VTREAGSSASRTTRSSPPTKARTRAAAGARGGSRSAPTREASCGSAAQRAPAPSPFHDRILDTALRRIRGKLDYAPIGYQLLPERFTLTELQQVYEAVLGEAVDKRNFRAKIRRAGEIRALDAFRTGSHRPARLYTFVGRVF
jgi:hypothetical protein